MTARWRPFDYESWQGLAADAITVEPARVVLVEGAYSPGPWLADLVDFAVLLTLDDEVRLCRLRAREGPERMARWLATWRPAEDAYFEHDRTPQSFDLVISGDSMDRQSAMSYTAPRNRPTTGR